MKQLIFVILISLLFGLFSFSSAREKASYADHRIFARARVEKIERAKFDSGPHLAEIRVHILILDGELKGRRYVSVYRGEGDMPRDMFYREGNNVFVGISKSQGADEIEYVSLYDVDNTAGLVILGLALAATIIAVGRLRGALSMVALIATVVLIFYLLIPLTLKGYPPLPLVLGIAMFAIAVTIPIILGFKKKTIAAALGAVSGVLLASILSLAAGWMMHLSGIVTNEMITVFYASDVDINLRGLALAGMVIAALGAIMDVCISIASATEELFRVHPELPLPEAFKSVMTVSSDMLGATMNTLLFAYVGSALPLVLLISMRLQPGMPFWMVFNYNPVLSELVKSAVGCIGMFLAMPATAFICIGLHKKGRKI